MAIKLSARTTVSLPKMAFAVRLADRNERKIHTRLSHELLSARIDMDKKVYRRISHNTYKTLQEHKDATRALEKINLSKKGRQFFDKAYTTLFTRNISQL